MPRTKSTDEMRDDFARVIRPLETADTLAPYYYFSDDVLERETDEIFLREWACIGREDEIPQAGDYFTMTILGETIIVCRDAAGGVQVLSAACRHRGALVVEGRGNRRSFECPFHGWVYGLDGSLKAAPQMHRTEGFERKECALPSIRHELWHGFLFINFDPDAAPLAPRLRGIDERFANYKFSDLRCAGEPMTFYNECNWKLSVEQGVDMYHVPSIHGQAGMEAAGIYKVNETVGAQDPDGAWTFSTTPTEKPHPFVTGTQLGKSPFPAIEGLTAHELSAFVLILIYPNTLIAPTPDGALLFCFYPEGPHRTMARLNVCYPESTTKMPDFEKHADDARKGFEVLNYEDMGGAKITHEGMNSRFLPAGRFSHLERTTWELNKYVIQKLQAADPSLR